MSEQPSELTELTVPTPAQWRDRFLAASDQDQLRNAGYVLEAYAARDRCLTNDHEAALILIRDHRCPTLEEIIAARVDSAYADGRNLGRIEGDRTARLEIAVGLDAALDAREAERRAAAHHDDDPQTEYADRG